LDCERIKTTFQAVDDGFCGSIRGRFHTVFIGKLKQNRQEEAGNGGDKFHRKIMHYFPMDTRLMRSLNSPAKAEFPFFNWKIYDAVLHQCEPGVQLHRLYQQVSFGAPALRRDDGLLQVESPQPLLKASASISGPTQFTIT
jgi:hypothetical protein